jgi:hypothetical protein
MLEETAFDLGYTAFEATDQVLRMAVATQDRVFSYYAPNSSIKHSKSDSKDRSQEIL